MQPDRTELEWRYEPNGFLEAGVHRTASDFELTVDGGLAKAITREPVDSVPIDLVDRIKAQIEGILDARQLLTHESYKLDEHPRIVHHRPDGTAITMLTGVSTILVQGHAPDVIVTDANGAIVQDTRAERLAEHRAFIDFVADAAERSDLLRSLLGSYRAAVNDPADELVHLYEIRDALKKHYGDEKKARAALKISKPEWQELGELANDRPLDQSRHRGTHVAGRRPATREELSVARRAARRLIEAFARTVI